MELDSTSRISQAQSAASKAEREAAERVTQAQKRVRETGREEETQIEHLRDQYDRRSEAERVRGDNYLETVRNRNYESVADLQRRGAKEEHKLTSTEQDKLNEIDRHFTDAKMAEARRGKAALAEETKTNFRQEEHERLTGNEKIEAIKTGLASEKAAYEAERRDTTAALTKQSQDRRHELEEKTRASIEGSETHYRDSYDAALKQNRDALADLNWRASREVEALKRETTTKLDGYAEQKSDPFYQMVSVDGHLTEKDDQFVFTAKIPEHERDRININIQGNELVISGKRKSEETLESEPGRVARTNSYQTFSESFPLNFPVNTKNMSREYVGDTLIVRIPKRTTYEPVRPKAAISRAAYERPHFPKNLPGEAELARLNDPERGPDPQTDDLPPSKRNKTGSILD